MAPAAPVFAGEPTPTEVSANPVGVDFTCDRSLPKGLLEQHATLGQLPVISARPVQFDQDLGLGAVL